MNTATTNDKPLVMAAALLGACGVITACAQSDPGFSRPLTLKQASELTSNMNTRTLFAALSLALGAIIVPADAAEQTTFSPGSAGATGIKHRSHLPMPNTVRQSYVNYDAKSPGTKTPPL